MKIINSLNGRIEDKKPIWIMRQAGRYLPEYRALRKKSKHFMDFCLNKEMVEEATIQPIQRFDFDAAIIFSDILVIPHFLGQTVHFEEGVGPLLDTPDWQKILETTLHENIQVVYESIGSVRKSLDPQKALIGFVGCPWTIASYMISGGKTKNFTELAVFCRNWPLFDKLIERLISAIANHAIDQLRSGANLVQLFESWAAAVPITLQKQWLFCPAEKIITQIREAVPGAQIIYYGKGVAAEAIKNLSHLNIGFGISHDTDLNTLKDTLVCLQGNLDPQKLLNGTFKSDVLAMLAFSNNRPFIVNLGHGILPETPIDYVKEFVGLVRGEL